MTQDPPAKKSPARRKAAAAIENASVSGASASGAASGPVSATIDTDPAIDYGLLSESLGFLLKRVQMAVFNDFIGRLAEQDIRPAQFSVLTIIARNPGLKQSQVSNALSIKRTNFVPLLDSLEGRGLVKRKAAAGDRRSHALHLTPKGTSLLTELERLWHEHEARVRALLGPEGHRQLFALLDKLSALEGPELDDAQPDNPAAEAASTKRTRRTAS